MGEEFGDKGEYSLNEKTEQSQRIGKREKEEIGRGREERD